MAGKRPALRCQYGALQLAALDAALHDDLAVELRGQRQGGFEFLAIVGLGNPHRRAEVGGLDEHGERQVRAGRRIEPFPRQHHVVYNRQHPFLTDTFHHLLIHGDGRRQHARADVGQGGQLEQPLHRAVFAEGSVQDGKHHVDLGLRAGLGQDGPGAPLAFAVDEVLDLLVLRGVHGVHDGARRPHGYVVLPGAAAVDDGYS